MNCTRKWFAVCLLGLSVLPLTLRGEDRRKVKVSVEPRYPEVAKRFRLSGTVKIEVTITPVGTVRSTKVIGGHPLLVESALEAVKRWKYEPANEETVQVESINYAQ